MAAMGHTYPAAAIRSFFARRAWTYRLRLEARSDGGEPEAGDVEGAEHSGGVRLRHP
jgi:hypothetical protein